MTISHRGFSATLFLPLPSISFAQTGNAGAYKPDDHYGVINFDERVIHAGQEVKGAGDVPLPLSRGHHRWGHPTKSPICKLKFDAIIIEMSNKIDRREKAIRHDIEKNNRDGLTGDWW